MLQRFLFLWLVLLSLLAFYWGSVWESLLNVLPNGGRFDAGWDPFVLTKSANLLTPMIQLTMFAIGCLISKEEIEQVLVKWPTVLGGTTVQYLGMPLLAFVIGRAFQLNEPQMIGLVMVGCVPGAMASNVLTMTAKGNVSYSVSLTTSATLLSPLAVPFALWLTLGASIEQDPLKVSFDLLKMVVGPVILGHALCRWWSQLATVMKHVAPVVANLVILWIIATVVGLQRERLTQVTAISLFALILVNAGGYLIGFGAGTAMPIDPAMRRALTLEVGMQNCGLGTVLTLTYFPDHPTAAILPAAYTFGCMATGTLLAQFWRWREEVSTSLQESAE